MPELVTAFLKRSDILMSLEFGVALDLGLFIVTKVFFSSCKLN
jgi:hypothetical protein